MNFKYTFKQNNGQVAVGYICLDKVAHIDFVKRDFERMEGDQKVVETKEGAVLTFPWQVQRQIPSPVYQTPNKAQRESGQLPPITAWKNELMWINYTVVIEEPSEVEQLKQIYEIDLEN